MKRTVASLGLVVLVMLPQLVAAREGEEVLTNEDIVTLTKAGLPTAGDRRQDRGDEVRLRYHSGAACGAGRGGESTPP